MAQADQSVQNATFPTVRADINNNLAALFSNNSGSIEPRVNTPGHPPAVAYMDWIDTGQSIDPSSTLPVWRKRNAGNNAWITIGTIVGNDLEFNGDITIRSQGALRLGDSNNSNWVVLQAPATVASNVTWTLPAADGSADQSIVTDGSGALSFAARSRLVSGTSVASTSGTSIDFTGIPSWVKRITIVFDQVSLSGTNNILVQIGDSGGLETTGYKSSSMAGTSTVTTDASSLGYVLKVSASAAGICGHMILTVVSGNTWISSHAAGRSDAGSIRVGGGTKTLSATLDRLSVLASGSNTFDGGTINILYEG